MKQNYLQLIIFGASGDLASIKLFPALFELFEQKQLPDKFEMIGFGRSDISQQDFRKMFLNSLKIDSPKQKLLAEKLLDKVFYFQGNYDDLGSFKKLNEFCDGLAAGQKVEQIAYFSVPPNVFENLVMNLSASLKIKTPDLKIVIEKPFGVDERSAQHLLSVIGEHFEETNVYLLDHYLGKRPIQSILKLRLENNVINLMIRPEEIANIQISALESLDVGKRVGYYDQVGCMRDMVQSHLLQILALITMDIPLTPTIESLQREKTNLISSLRFSGKTDDLVFGQFDSYKKLDGVAESSKTDTLVGLKLTIDRRDWFNVPVYFRAGKKLGGTLTKVVIEFKKMPFQNKQVASNKLIFEMKPMEGIGLSLVQERQTKTGVELENLALQQSLACSVDFCLGDYASLLLDIMKGKKNYFLSYPEIIAAWKVTDSIEKIRPNISIKNYRDGGDGPKEYLELPTIEGFTWN